MSGIKQSQANVPDELYIGVAATRKGIGCTHLACALALAICGGSKRKEAFSTVLVLRSRAECDRLASLVSGPPGEDGLHTFAGMLDFCFWDDFAPGRHRYAVFDCGIVDLDGTASSSPASRFKNSWVSVMLVSGALWDLGGIQKLVGGFNPTVLRGWKWCVRGGSDSTAATLDGFLDKQLGQGYSGLFRVPERRDLFATRASRVELYMPVISGILPEWYLDRLLGKEEGCAGDEAETRNGPATEDVASGGPEKDSPASSPNEAGKRD